MDKEDTSRILEAFAYIAKGMPERKKNIYNVLKVFYLADKLHMERYGRFIFSDSYAALRMGPVPSHAYDLIKLIRDGKSLPDDCRATVSVQNNILTPLCEYNEDLFSGSDMVCIDDVIEQSATEDLGDLSHDPAWDQTSRNSTMSIESILATLPNSEALISLHQNRHP